MEPHRARRKHRRLGNLIPFCDHVRHYLDLGKVTGNQRKIDFSKIWNNRKKEKMKRIFTFTIILMALTACTSFQVQTSELCCDGHASGKYAKSCLGLLQGAMGTNSKFARLPMAAKTEYVFFRMAAPVTSGPISGESVVPQHKKARHLP